MSNKIVLDSCVFNKIFLQEPERDKAIALINHLTKQSYQIIAPSLFLYEVLAVAKVNNIDNKQIYPIILKSWIQVINAIPEFMRLCVQ
ncbi:MAG: hypothetical protein WCK96_01855, partial [Methylococcales bacterium]